jgi:predicted permease
MLKILYQLGFFVGLGVAWRYVSPMGVSAGAMLRPVLVLLYTVFLPALTLSVMWKLPLTSTTLRIVLVMIGATAVGLAAAWFYFKSRNISPRSQAAFILAAAFGNVLVLGMPITQAVVAKWTVRGAVEFEVFAVLPLLFTAGVFIAHKLGERGNEAPGVGLIKQPIIIMALLGLLLNLAKVKMPGLVAVWVQMAAMGIVPLGMIAVGLALQWHKQWNELISYLVPVAVIQLVIVPLALWGLFHIFGLSGPQTYRSMMLQAAMPAMLIGFLFCEKYKLDMTAYTAAFSFTTVVSIATTPLWLSLITNGVLR